eukprot:COSAG03_NODE_499_length_7409_cov_11.656088_14_plen_150_part_00
MCWLPRWCASRKRIGREAEDEDEVKMVVEPPVDRVPSRTIDMRRCSASCSERNKATFSLRDGRFLPVGARRRPITLGRVRERPMRLRARAWVRFDWQNDWGRVAFRRLASAITLVESSVIALRAARAARGRAAAPQGPYLYMGYHTSRV